MRRDADEIERMAHAIDLVLAASVAGREGVALSDLARAAYLALHPTPPPAPDPGLVTARALLERVAAMHPDPCDDQACPMPEIRAWLAVRR